MEKNIVSSINQEVYKRFPEMRGVTPKMQKLEQNTLLIYQTKIITSNQTTINRSIRVVVDERGTIVKLSTSR